jgi:hypothetical protein
MLKELAYSAPFIGFAVVVNCYGIGSFMGWW